MISMMPPPELQEIETFLSSSLPNIHSMRVDDKDNNTLVLSGGDAATSKLFLKFARHHKTFEPLESYKQ